MTDTTGCNWPLQILSIRQILMNVKFFLLFLIKERENFLWKNFTARKKRIYLTDDRKYQVPNFFQNQQEKAKSVSIATLTYCQNMPVVLVDIVTFDTDLPVLCLLDLWPQQGHAVCDLVGKVTGENVVRAGHGKGSHLLCCLQVLGLSRGLVQLLQPDRKAKERLKK